MLSNLSKTASFTLPLAVMLTACGGSSGGTTTPPVTPQLVQLFIGDDCPLENVRVLINNSKGELIGDTQSNAEGIFNVTQVPENGSFGLVYADMNDGSTYDGTWVAHIDRSLIMDNSSIHIIDPAGVCDSGSAEPADTFTVTIDNFDDFDRVSYRSDGLEPVYGEQVELPVNGGTVLVLASNASILNSVESSDFEFYTVIETSDFESGESVTVTLDRPTRELGAFKAPGSTTDSNNVYWISESGSRIELFPYIDFSKPVMVIDEPGRFVARGLLYDGPVSETRGNDYVVVDSAAVSGEVLVFTDQRDKLQQTLFTDGRFYFEYYGKEAGYTLGTVVAPQLRRFYIANQGTSPLKMPELTNDLLIAGGAVEQASLFIDTLDPQKYSVSSVWAIELRVDGEPATSQSGQPTRALSESHVNYYQSGL
ncbi:MAG: hypothetical protein LAT63_08180 [Marinobacter sp.]|nr:hypothetical protein [Marinobacter sp.]